MDANGRIDLAHAADFAIGAFVVRPPTREVVVGDGTREVLEPRVMQVLVALARTDGAILSRDDLTHSCWEGRVVGEDAINRVISRLRKVAETAGTFRIETITKVGYRLVRVDDNGAPVEPATPEQAPRTFDRRLMLGSATLAVLAGGAGLFWLDHRGAAQPSPPLPPPQAVATLMTQAFTSLRQASPDGFAQGLGLLRRVVALAPDYADGWGGLAIAYAFAARDRTPASYVEMTARTRAAAQRALTLDPDNAFAQAALAWLMPKRGNWRRVEQILRRGLARHPNSDVLLLSLAQILPAVGRMREMAAVMDRVVAIAPMTPAVAFVRMRMLWAADRLEEADRASDEGIALFPLHIAVWFTRCYLFLYTGRAGQALEMLNHVDDRPPGLPSEAFDLVAAVARAMISGAKADVDAAVAMNVAAAHRSEIFAANAIQFSAALGRIDDAFAVADAYFFDRGFSVATMGYSPQQASMRLANRDSELLFLPSTAAMRADPRFEPLVTQLGLTSYWAQSGHGPDYRSRQ